MKRRNLRLVFLLLCCVFIFNFCLPLGVVQAESLPQRENLTDIGGHWAEREINKWLSQSLVGGYADGTFKADHQLTRAEFVAMVNRAFGYKQSDPLRFTDVLAEDWYAADVAKAVATGYINGYPDGTFQPNQPISRQEVAAVLTRILSLQGGSEESLYKYQDQAEIPFWSLAAINAISENGYMGGYLDGTFQPTKALTRAEAISVLDRAVGVLYNQAGTYGSLLTTTTIEGNVTITTPGTILKNVLITGNVYLTEGIEVGQVILDNVQIQGTVKISGGTEVNLTSRTQLNNVIIDSPVSITGRGKIEKAQINAAGVKIETKPSKVEVAEGVTDFKTNEREKSTQRPIKVSGVNLVKSEMELAGGNKETLVAIVQPDNATNKKVIWSSNNEGVAIVDVSGEVTPVAEGTAIITVTTEDGGYTDTCEATVVPLAPDTYTVGFNSNGGTAVDSTTGVRYGDTITAPENPTKTGYTFDGWYKETELSNAWVFATDTVTADTTLYAKWSVNQYTITFNSAGGSAVASITQAYGTVVTPPANPTRTGYTFTSWDPALPDTMPAEDTTVTAQWSANTDTAYQVEHYQQEVSGAGYTKFETENLSGTTGETATAEAKDYTGFTENTTHGDSVASGTIAADGSLVLKLYYDRDTYTVSFNSNGGTAVDATTGVRYGDTITAPENPTKTGYTFDGWYKETELTNAWVFATDTVTADTTLYAKWSVNQYTITFDSNGGSAVASITQDYGTAVTPPANPTRTGYTFTSWEPALPDTMSAEDTTVTAQWSANTDTAYKVEHYQQDVSGDGYTLKETDNLTGTTDTEATAIAKPYTGFTENTTHESRVSSGTIKPDGSLVLMLYYDRDTFTVSFNSNGGSAISDITGVRYEATIPAPTAPDKTGYTFGGWFKDEGLTNEWSFEIDTVTENTTLYAKWTINQYTIAFDSVGGTSIADITQDYGTAVVAPADPAREGYTFAGWEPALPATMPAEDLNLTAKWETIEYAITYDLGGGVNDANNPISYNIETADITLAVATKEGYTFAGWWDAASDGNQVTSISKGSTGDKTLYARWTPNTDTAYTVVHYQQDVSGEGYTLKDTDNLTGTTDTEATATAKPYTGFTENTTHESRVSSGTIKPDGSLVLRLYYDRNTFTVSFNSNGGSAISDITGVRYEATIPAPTAPDKTGYTFGGWFKDEALENAWNFESDRVTENTTLYAKWTINTYTVTFDSNGGNTEANPSSKTATHGGNVGTLPTAPTKVGHTFAGWNTQADGNGTAFTVATPVTDNITVYAQWKVNVTGVSLNKATTTLAVGALEALTAMVEPDNASNKNVSWSSDNTAVATVADGEVTAKAAGTATITVTTADGSKTATCAVTVVEPGPISDFVCTTKTDTTATFSWTGAVEATSIRIEQSTDGGTTWTEATTGVIEPTATTATVSGLIGATTYQFKLVVTAGYNAGDSNMVEVTTAVPAGVQAAGVSWTVGESTEMTRLGDGVDQTAGVGFNTIFPWSEMKLCNVADDGRINAYIGDVGFARDGTNGQVMVKIPKFYYKHTFTGTKHEFWVTDKPTTGFKLHPSFSRAGVEMPYVLMGAYKAGEEVVGETTKLTSVSGELPAVSRTRATFREQAQNRGNGWEITDALSRNAVALLYLVEYADTDSQTAIGKGISELRYNAADTITEATIDTNKIIVSSATGSYYKVGQIVDVGTSTGARNICKNRTITNITTGETKTTITVDGALFTTAVGNIIYHVGQKTGGCDSLDIPSGIAPFGTDGKVGVNGQVSVSYRGLEDLWGNVLEFIDGINIKNSEKQPYIADSNFVDDSFTRDYKASGVALPGTNGYWFDFAVSEKSDWLLMLSAIGGSESTYVPDWYYQNWGSTEDKVVLSGGYWSESYFTGLFYLGVYAQSGFAHIAAGARVMRIPTGFVSGTVTAEGGGAIAGATVSVKSGEIVVGSAITDADGMYTVSNIPAGTYTVEFAAEGYATATTADVVVNVDQTTVNINKALVAVVSGPLSDFAYTTKTDTTVTFSWTGAVGATSIRIEQSTDGGTTWTEATTGVIEPTATTATVSGLIGATTYQFKLVVTGGYNAGDSNVVEVTTTVPAGVKAAGVSWTVGESTEMTRLGDGVDQTAGVGFNSIFPWSEMKLCNVADDGTINAYIGDAGFKRDGSNGQVMVKIPKFYYKHTSTGTKHEFWVADSPTTGFKLHPSFSRAGVEMPYVLMGAYKAGEEVKGTTKLTSVSGSLPAVSQTRATFREQAQNRGKGWEIVDALSRNAVALLYLVEYADTNCQTAVGRGIVDLRYHEADVITEATTGNTIVVSYNTTGKYYKVGQIIDVGTSLGARNICKNRKIIGITTEADKTTITVDEVGGNFTTAVGNILYHVGQKSGGCDGLDIPSGIAPFGTDGKKGVDGQVSVSYRGLEDLWGNVWEFIDGININNDEKQPYIADHGFKDNQFSSESTYQASGVILPSNEGYVKDFALSAEADWLLMPSTVGGSYIPDYYYQNWAWAVDKVALVGGGWFYGNLAGLFYWHVHYSSADSWIHDGARVMRIPTGFVSGTVTAEGGEAITEATVSVKSGETIVGSTITGVDGTYTVSNIPAGTYTVEVAAEGYYTATIADVDVSVNETTVNIDKALVAIESGPVSDFECSAKTDTTAEFSWTEAVEATSIQIEQSINGGTTWVEATTGALYATATTATVTGLVGATTYKFKLVVSEGYNAGDSNIVEVTTASVVGVSWTVGEATTMDRLGVGLGKDAGGDFDSLYPWSEMKLCNVNDEGTIVAELNGAGFFERDNPNKQVMVKIPKFYYKHTWDKDEAGNVTKHEFWVADQPVAGFELHPCFMRAEGEKDYVLMGAYKASDAEGGKLASISGALPAVSRTRETFRTQAHNRGDTWEIVDALSRNAVSLLYLVEYADTNSQTGTGAIGSGITGLRYYEADVITEASTESNTIIVSPTTGGYYKVGQVIDVGKSRGARDICKNRTITEITTEVEAGKTTITVDGAAFSTTTADVDLGTPVNIIYHVGQRTGGCDSLDGESGRAPFGTDGTAGVDGQVSVSYRGLEDLWGNVWEFIDGINIKNATREPYIADHGFEDDQFSSESTYQATGIILSETSGYCTDFAVSAGADWLLMPSSVSVSYSTYIPDHYSQNWAWAVDKVSLAGGAWNSDYAAGLFYWLVDNSLGSAVHITFGARSLQIPK